MIEEFVGEVGGNIVDLRENSSEFDIYIFSKL